MEKKKKNKAENYLIADKEKLRKVVRKIVDENEDYVEKIQSKIECKLTHGDVFADIIAKGYVISKLNLSTVLDEIKNEISFLRKNYAYQKTNDKLQFAKKNLEGKFFIKKDSENSIAFFNVKKVYIEKKESLFEDYSNSIVFDGLYFDIASNGKGFSCYSTRQKITATLLLSFLNGEYRLGDDVIEVNEEQFNEKYNYFLELYKNFSTFFEENIFLFKKQ